MLAGIYTIQPLQSSIGLNSTTLYPSGRPYPVFAPSSHPIPIITPSPAGSSSRRTLQPSRSLSKLPLPSTFQLGESRTVVLIREYECGLTGLRNGVLPGFSNIWGEDKGIWGLKSVHPVRLSPLTDTKDISDQSGHWEHTFHLLSTCSAHDVDSSSAIPHCGDRDQRPLSRR